MRQVPPIGEWGVPTDPGPSEHDDAVTDPPDRGLPDDPCAAWAVALLES